MNFIEEDFKPYFINSVKACYTISELEEILNRAMVKVMGKIAIKPFRKNFLK